jgi:hypothetical protein
MLGEATAGNERKKQQHTFASMSAFSVTGTGKTHCMSLRFFWNKILGVLSPRVKVQAQLWTRMIVPANSRCEF